MPVEQTIPQRELRNNVSQVLKDVAAGKSFRVTVSGKAVAELVPVVEGEPRAFVTRSKVEAIIRDAPLDPGFRRDLEAAAGATIDEL